MLFKILVIFLIYCKAMVFLTYSIPKFKLRAYSKERLVQCKNGGVVYRVAYQVKVLDLVWFADQCCQLPYLCFSRQTKGGATFGI